MKGRYGSRMERRHAPRRTMRVSSAIAARTVSGWTPRLRDDGADLPMLAEIESADLGVLLGRDHRVPFSDTRRTGQVSGTTHATLAATDHTARRGRGRGADGRRSRRACPQAECVAGDRAAGKCDPSRARPIRPLMVAVIQAAFRAAAMPAFAAAHAAARPAALTRRRAVGVTAITGEANRKQGAAARHVFWRSGTSSMASPQQRGAPPGHHADSVAQETATASDGPGEPEVVTRVRRIRPGPHLCLPPQPTRSASTATPQSRGRCRTYGRADAPTAPCKSAPNASFPQRPPPSFFLSTGLERKGPVDRPSRFLRFYLATNTWRNRRSLGRARLCVPASATASGGTDRR